MEIRCSSATARDWTGEALVVGLFSDAPGEGSRELLKSRFGEALLARMERRRFKAKPGESLVVELLDQQPSTLVLVGGVAANRRLRQRLEQRCGELGIQWRLAPLAYCTDNAAMIAVAAEQRFQAGSQSSIELAVAPRLALEEAPVLYEPQPAF